MSNKDINTSRRKFARNIVVAFIGGIVVPSLVSRDNSIGFLAKTYTSPSDIIEVVSPDVIDIAGSNASNIYNSSNGFIAYANTNALAIDVSNRAAPNHIRAMGINSSFGSSFNLSNVPSACLENFRSAEPEIRENAELLLPASASRDDRSITAAASIKNNRSNRTPNSRSSVATQYGSRPLVSVGNIDSGILSGAASLADQLYRNPSSGDRARLATPTATALDNKSPDGIPYDVFATASGLNLAHYKEPKGDFDGFIAFIRDSDKKTIGTVPIVYVS